MSDNAPTPDEWRRLFDAMIKIKELAPWAWMREARVFGVKNPATGELGFVSVMGMLGEHFAIAVYRGARGLYNLYALEEEQPDSPQIYLETGQLQASFENRQDLRPEDYAIIKQLGLKFRGRHAWPQFRCFRPGFVPWFLEAAEARFLAHALEQTLAVGPRLKANPDLLPSADDERYLVRVAHDEDGELVWADEIISVPPPGKVYVDVYMDMDALAHLQQLPSSRVRVEIDLIMIRSPVKDDGVDRPFYPYALMTVNAQNGIIMGMELLPPVPTLEMMWGTVAAALVRQLAQASVRPARAKVRTPLLLQLVQPVADAVGFRVRQSDYLPQLEVAKGMLLDYFDPRSAGWYR
jgi:hypothetical protein